MQVSIIRVLCDSASAISNVETNVSLRINVTLNEIKIPHALMDNFSLESFPLPRLAFEYGLISNQLLCVINQVES